MINVYLQLIVRFTYFCWLYFNIWYAMLKSSNKNEAAAPSGTDKTTFVWFNLSLSFRAHFSTKHRIGYSVLETDLCTPPRLFREWMTLTLVEWQSRLVPAQKGETFSGLHFNSSDFRPEPRRALLSRLYKSFVDLAAQTLAIRWHYCLSTHEKCPGAKINIYMEL